MVFVSVYKKDGNGRCVKTILGQVCKYAYRWSGPPCGCDIVHFTLLIKEPVCSDETIYFDILSNYVEICDL